MESDFPPPEFDNFGRRTEDKVLPPRVTKLEVDVSDLRARLDQLATKEDLAKLDAKVEGLQGRLVKWMVGLFVGFTTLNIVVMTFVVNYAAPPHGRFAKPMEISAPAAAPPIVIVVPMLPGVQWQAQPPKQP